MSPTFKELYCAHFQVMDQEFEESLFRKALYPVSRSLSVVLYRFYPRFFELDFLLLKRLGSCTSFTDFQDEAEKVAFRYRKAQDYSLYRKVLKMRLSTRRLLRLGVMLWRKHIESQGGK